MVYAAKNWAICSAYTILSNNLSSVLRNENERRKANPRMLISMRTLTLRRKQAKRRKLLRNVFQATSSACHKNVLKNLSVLAWWRHSRPQRRRLTAWPKEHGRSTRRWSRRHHATHHLVLASQPGWVEPRRSRLHRVVVKPSQTLLQIGRLLCLSLSVHLFHLE